MDGGGTRLAAARTLAGIVDDNRLAGVGASALESDMRLVDDDLLAVGSGCDEDDAARRWQVIDRGLHGGVFASAVSSDMEGGSVGIGNLPVDLAVGGRGANDGGECKNRKRSGRTKICSR